MTFRILPLSYASFGQLFALDEAGLAAHGARRVIADRSPGFPCRVSLADAEPGETLVLVHHQHQSADTPFRASHAIYVRQDAAEACPAAGEVPAMLRHRLMSLRGFDAAGMMIAADAVAGTALEPAIAAMLDDPEVAYLHLHFAKPGCYAARVERAHTGAVLVRAGTEG